MLSTRIEYYCHYLRPGGVTMRHPILDFNTIERALLCSIEALEGDETHHPALEHLINAQEELKRALSFSLSRVNGQ